MRRTGRTLPSTRDVANQLRAGWALQTDALSLTAPLSGGAREALGLRGLDGARAPTAASAALMPKHLGEKKRRLAGSFADEGKLLGPSVDSSLSAMAGFYAHEIHPVLLADLESLRVRS